MSRPRPVGHPTDQNEVYIRHVVGTSTSSRYQEVFVTYYAHMDTRHVSTGDSVTQGQSVGPVGATGSVSPPDSAHLHFGVFRLRNVSDAWKDYSTYPSSGTIASSSFTHDETRAVDPFGWTSSSCGDPAGLWAPAGMMAPNIDLWIPGYAPPDWDNHSGH